MHYRIEKDTMGEVQVPEGKYWGVQTQRSIMNFSIGPAASMPVEIIYAFGYLKKAAALTNNKFGLLSSDKMISFRRSVMKLWQESLMTIFLWSFGRQVQELIQI